ncbi:hypothetical protein HRR83_001704 [Exophiala dermatitidis]|nr:hypothetical protein HRR73_004838 [Exophiala dermatitidis]KAJ4526510.1 hypothetical protein HRR74_001708 [Exophiala dermatitidis]KAJ4532243.1 hypothetical protein HRR76_007242 [Exophiala dermatitidis]KAJ4546279.1 hypothetical protein HRR77_004815 [Exophiala dermatitidis]KAJ4567478.1 hypothetical protein HRR79_004992 [Exophiala dermatitidis]
MEKQFHGELICLLEIVLKFHLDKVVCACYTSQNATPCNHRYLLSAYLKYPCLDFANKLQLFLKIDLSHPLEVMNTEARMNTITPSSTYHIYIYEQRAVADMSPPTVRT